MNVEPIFLVTCGEYSDYRVDSVFETRELAEEYINGNNFYTIEEQDLIKEGTNIKHLPFFDFRIEFLNGLEKEYEKFGTEVNIKASWLNDFFVYKEPTSRGFWLGSRFEIEHEQDEKINQVKEYVRHACQELTELLNQGDLEDEKIKKMVADGELFIKETIKG